MLAGLPQALGQTLSHHNETWRDMSALIRKNNASAETAF